MTHSDAWAALARCLDLGEVLERLRVAHGGYELLLHHTQGEFHHDLALRPRRPEGLPAPVLVVSTNCNGGVKELLALDAAPTPGALWHARCPAVPEFSGELGPVRAEHRTHHWHDPCELLAEDARSELRPEHRERQEGGGWRMRSCGVGRGEP